MLEPKTTQVATGRLWMFVRLGGVIFAFAMFLKIAWVTDDAYIVFRSIEQFFAGNGPRWNPHERVQVFTSPLWFGYLCLFRAVSSNVFLNAIVASGIALVAMLAAMRWLLRDSLKWLVALGLLMCSNGFYDYTSSGLEGPLAYLLIVVYLCNYQCVFASGGTASDRRVLALLLVFGFALTCRHDLATLLTAPTLYAVWVCRSQRTTRQWIVYGLIGLFPLLAWSLVSLIYYGSALPNTAYAKLDTGIAESELLRLGLGYIMDSLRHDTITVIGIIVSIVALLGSRSSPARWLGVGLLLNLGYVIIVGGDFMRGRFLAFGYLVASLSLVSYRFDAHVHRPRRVAMAVLIVCVAYMAFYPHTPVNSPWAHEDFVERPMGVIDERGFYARASLRQYVFRKGEVFPEHEWAVYGHGWAQNPALYIERGVIGYFGYWAGLDKIIVDPFALADPFLARLPVDRTTRWRIGHFRRKIPPGYRETVLSDRVQMLDPGLNEFYTRLALATRSDKLFTWRRMRAIAAMNLGVYDHYLDDYRERNLANR